MRNESVDSAPWFSFTRSGCEGRLCTHLLPHRKGEHASRFCRGTSEKALRFPKPTAFVSQSVYLETGRYGCAGFNGLLIKARLLFALGVKAPGADGHKDLFVASMLCRDQPLQGLDSLGYHLPIFAAPSG